jgi:hypothetical protein
MAKSGLHLKARQILKDLYPSIQILEEIQIPIRKSEYLIVDFFIPLLSIIVEVQGQQHYEKSSLFHKSDNDFIKQKNNITKDNIPLLQILDAIRNIKKIPDTTVTNSCIRFIAILRQLKEKDLLLIMRLANKYPPATRALLGAMLDEIKSTL